MLCSTFPCHHNTIIYGDYLVFFHFRCLLFLWLIVNLCILDVLSSSYLFAVISIEKLLLNDMIVHSRGFTCHVQRCLLTISTIKSCASLIRIARMESLSKLFHFSVFIPCSTWFFGLLNIGLNHGIWRLS